MESTKKLAYEAPQLIEIGTFEAITQAACSGHALDAAFSAGASNITFSDVPNGSHTFSAC